MIEHGKSDYLVDVLISHSRSRQLGCETRGTGCDFAEETLEICDIELRRKCKCAIC